jgi:microcompartment protein CcmK/EutM
LIWCFRSAGPIKPKRKWAETRFSLREEVGMQLGRVAGTLVSSEKDPLMEGMKFLVVATIDTDNADSGSYVVAVDAVGAGVGEVVMYASGSSARQTTVTKDRPCDAVIMAIVDTWEVDGETRYTK